MIKSHVTSGFGSYEMQDLLGKRKAQETERQDKERESSSKRSDRVTRKANEEAEATARWEGWDAFRGGVCVWISRRRSNAGGLASRAAGMLSLCYEEQMRKERV